MTEQTAAETALVLERNVGVVLDQLRAAGTRRSPLAALLAARSAAEAIEEATRLAVADARRAGHTWQDIGELLATTRQAAQQRYGERAPRPQPAGSSALGDRALSLIAALRDGDAARAASDFDAELRRRLPPDELRATWERLVAHAGGLEAMGRPAPTRRGPYDVVDVPLVFARGPMRARVTFGGAGEVAGLFFLLPDGP